MEDAKSAIQQNVQLVIKKLGPLSGIEFGLNRDSVAWVEGFIERQRLQPEFDPDAVGGLVNTLGSFLGECIAANAGGVWQWSEQQQSMGVVFTGNSFAFPFAKVEKLFKNGLEGGDSILSFYDIAVDFIAKGKLNTK
jgi:hypothetical protein